MQAIVVFLLLVSVISPSVLTAEPLRVRDAVERGVAFHPVLQAAAATVQSAKGERLSSLSPDAPTLSTEFEGIPRGGSLSQYGERRIAVTQEFDFPIKYVWRSLSANSGVLASQQQALSLLLDLELAIRATYAEAWFLEEKIAILTGNVEAARIYASHLERKVELGEAVPLEARRARVEYLQAKSQLAEAVSDHIAVQARLARMTGIDTSELALESPLGLLSTKASESADASLTDNPELKAAAYELEQARSELTLARAAWLPDLEFSYFQQKAPAESKPHFWGVEVGISLPVWYWLGGRGEIQSATARRRASSAGLANQRIEKSSEMDRLIQAINAMSETHRLYRSEVVPAAKEAYDLAMKSYRLGEANYLQVLDAQRSAFAIQVEFIEIERELYQNLTELDRLAGRSVVGISELHKLLEKGN